MKKYIALTLFFVGQSVGCKTVHADLFTATLIDHVSPVTQVKSGNTDIALVDSIIQIGNYQQRSILDVQAGFSGSTVPEEGATSVASLIGGGFFKLSTLTTPHVHFPDQWQFLKSLEYGPVYFYDFRNHRGYAGFQFGLAFTLQPKA